MNYYRLPIAAYRLMIVGSIAGFTGLWTGASCQAGGTPVSKATISALPLDVSQGVVEAVIDKVKPALIRIMVVSADYEQGRERKTETSGSGIIISSAGFAVTNHHVAGDAKSLRVTLANKEEVDADLVGTDPLADIAVIKLRGAPGQIFPVASFGDSSTLRVGDRVLAMGSPFSLSQSVTTGIVSNTEMIMPEFMWPFNKLELAGEDVGSMVRWIGHDAMIAGGNSGGPLVNMRGEIVGINEIDLALSGAIPSNIAKPVAEQLIKTGKVTRSWLGIEIQPLLKGFADKHGALVGGVWTRSPAAVAGIKSGDVIKRINGEDVTVRFGEDVPIFNQIIAALPVGQPVNITVERNDKVLTFKPITILREEATPKESEFKGWGLTAMNLSSMIARGLGRGNQNGALIASVATSGPAADAKPPLEDGDIIVKVAGRAINSTQDLRKVSEDLTKGKKQRIPALVEFDRKTERYLTLVRLGQDPLRDPGLEASKAWVPIGFQVLTPDVAQALGVADAIGVRVTEVYPNHSAAKAGLKVGDIITKLDGESIEASQPQDYEVFPAMVREKTIGDTAKLTILRNDKLLNLQVMLESSPKLPREMKRYRSDEFEFTARNMTFDDKDRGAAANKAVGVVVENVDEGGWAALGRLAVGDVVMDVDGQKVANVAELETVMNKIRKERPKDVVFHVERSNSELFVEVQPAWATVE